MSTREFMYKYCPKCNKDVIVAKKMFNTTICTICNIIIDSPTRDRVGR